MYELSNQSSTDLNIERTKDKKYIVYSKNKIIAQTISPEAANAVCRLVSYNFARQIS